MTCAMLRIAITIASSILLASCAITPQPPLSVRSDLAPTGKLRVGINFQNVLLAAKDPVNGEPRGIAVDLARELGQRLDVPVEIIAFETAGKMADAVKTGAWDVAFLAIELQRANEIAFTSPYLEMDATYLVPAGSHLRNIVDVDREGVRIAVAAKGAPDLFLTRSLQRAQLMRAPTISAAAKLFVATKLEALAGYRPRLEAFAKQLPGSRILDDRFSVTQQAAGTPKGRDAGANYLRVFIEDVKASGWVAQAIETHGIRGVSVAPITGERR